MKKATILLTLVSILIVSCIKDDLRHSQDYAGTFPTFYASFDNQAETDTKTYLDGKMTLRWTKGDSLSVFVGNTYNHKYKFDGETGANNGSFSAITSPEFIAAEPLDANYAVYPYNASNEMSSDGSMSVILPSVQKYAQNSFGLGANMMVAATESKEDNFLQFKNLCGYVVVKLYGEGTVTSIKLEGNDGEKISGKADVQAAFGTLPSVTMSEEATTSITLDCGEGVALGTTAETATEFWLCVPPVTFSKGFTVTATKADGWQMVKSTSTSKEVVRNTKNALAPIEAVFDTPSAEVVPPDDEIWYTSTNGSVIEINPNCPFNVKLISNTYKDGKGILKFNGPLTTLGSFGYGGAYMYGHYTENEEGIISINFPNTLEKIGSTAFYNCFHLKNVRLPEGISTLGSQCFMNCYKLEEINIPSSVIEFGFGIFNCCRSLQRFTGDNSAISQDGRSLIVDNILNSFAPVGVSSYTVPEGVETIGLGAFSDIYDSLEEIILPSSVKHIESSAFDYCTGLKTISLPDGLLDIGQWAFRGNQLETVHIPQSVMSIGNAVFGRCSKLKSFTGKFASSDGLFLVVNGEIVSVAIAGFGKTVTIPNGVTIIGNQIFEQGVPVEIEEVVLPEGLISIGTQAFSYWTKLKKINIPSSVIELGLNPFEECYNLEAFEGNNSFISEDKRCLIVGTTLVSVAPGGLDEFTVPEGVTEIGFGVFGDFSPLSSIIIPEGVEYLGERMCRYCNNLTTITIPSSVKNIDTEAFYGCRNLKDIYCKALIPPALANPYDNRPETIFAQQSWDEEAVKSKIYVPRQSVSIYKSSWPWYADIIEGYDYTDLDIDYYISTDYSSDGTVHTVQTATVGNGANVVLMGDAFSDRQIADGTYNNVMQKAVNALFSEEPYKSNKDYFNVYIIDAVSMTEGYEHGGQVFSTGHGDGTYVYGNDNKVFEYAQKALTVEQMDDALIIVMMNEDAYAGTCFMYYPNSGDYGRGPSIAYFPTSSDTDTFNGLVSHEAGGHGFAKLGDEYAYEYMGAIPYGEMESTKQMEPYGWYKNVDFTPDPTQVKWSKFLSDERYANEGLGCFEGGLTYWSGVWRPTDYSIMRYNTGGFNAPSREAIWYRIHKLAYGEDWEYNYEDFVAYDAINRTPAAQAASRAKVAKAAAARKGKPFQPLHEPVIINRSWKDAVNNSGQNGR